MATLRLHLLIGTMVLAAAGCAEQPREAASSPPPAAAAATPAASAAAKPMQAVLADVPGLTPHVLAMARDDGYRPRVVDGQVQFCRVEIPVGTALRHRHCVNATALRWEVEQEQEQRRDLRQSPPTICRDMGC